MSLLHNINNIIAVSSHSEDIKTSRVYSDIIIQLLCLSDCVLVQLQLL